VSLVTHQYAKKAGFGRRPVSIRITGVGAGGGGESTVQYRTLLRRRDGSIAEIKPYGVDKIMGNATSLNLSKAKALFPSAVSELESLAGPVQLLIGMDHMEEAPREVGRAQGVALYRSRFGTGYVAGGNMTYQPSQTTSSGTPSESLKLPDRAVQPSGVHTSGGHGDGSASKVSCLQELQRMPVPHGQLDFQEACRVHMKSY
jgi:hypothetical protein